MSLIAEIQKKLEDNLQIDHLEIINESHKHAGHHGHNGKGETHLKLIVVSPDFSSCSRLQRHTIINNILKQYFIMDLHALTCHLFAPGEYDRIK